MSLKKLIPIIEQNYDLIANNWLNTKSVKSTLKTRNISIEKFKHRYAIPIIKHFIFVIEGKRKQGDCPVMRKLINYFLSKFITPREVFDICMGLKSNFIYFLLDKKLINKELIFYLNEINIIFDSNLSGVLDIFTTTYTKLQSNTHYLTFEHLILDMIDKSKKSKKRLFLAIVDIVDSDDDKIIAEVIEDLIALTNKKIFISRLEINRFGILLDYPNEQVSYDWCVELFKKLNEKYGRKTVTITEVDLKDSINNLLLRTYSLSESSNNSEDIVVKTDFKNIVKYKELPNQIELVKKFGKLGKIQFTIFYKELPISFESKILKRTNTTIDMLFSKKQIKIAKIGMPIYLKLENIGFIQANLFKLDDNIATINNFRLNKHTPLNRQRYRITISNHIKAYISFQDRDYDVDILNMNEEYIAIKIDRKRNFSISDIVYLDMLLFISDKFEECSFNATIIKIDRIKSGYKILLFCNLDYKNKEILRNYISELQMEIIHGFIN